MRLREIKKIFEKVLLIILKGFPVNNRKIVVQNFAGRGYGDNPKYIVEEIIKKNENFKIIWLCKDMKENMPARIKKVKYGHIRSYYELSTAGVWIDNIRTGMRPVKKKNQIYIQTWHAAYGPKLVEGQVETTLSEDYVKLAKRDGRMTDAILADNEMQKKQFEQYYWLNQDTKIMTVGLPRIDFLIKNKNNVELIQKLKKKIGASLSDYLILYAPTFREKKYLYNYKIEIEKIKQQFDAKMGKNSKIIVRLHPSIAKKGDLFEYNEYTINGNDYSDPQELTLISDCVITDYSSIAFDFSVIEKKVILYVPDLETYNKTGRLSQEFFKFPFFIAKNELELYKAIQCIDSEAYAKKLQKYFEENAFYDKGDASEKVVQWIKSNIK